MKAALLRLMLSTNGQSPTNRENDPLSLIPSVTMKTTSRHKHFGGASDVHGHRLTPHLDSTREDLKNPHRKMPGLLRLNSIGEKSSLHLPAETRVKKDREIENFNCSTSPSMDSFLSSLSQSIYSTMSSTKKLRSSSSNHSDCYKSSPALIKKSYSLPETWQHPIIDFNKLPFNGNHSSSFDPNRKTFCNFATSSSLKMNRSWVITSMGADFNAAEDLVPSLFTKLNIFNQVPSSVNPAAVDTKQFMTYRNNSAANDLLHVPSESLLSATTSAKTIATPTRDQSMYDIPPHSNYSEEVISSCSSINSSLQLLKKPTMHPKNCDLPLSDSDSYSAASEMPEFTDSSVTFSEKVSCQDSNYSKSLDVSFDEVFSSPNSFKNCSTVQKLGSDCDKAEFRKSEETKESNMNSVLFTPRKTTKKGRPSSKKQKKRQRQKQKHLTQVVETCNAPETKLESYNFLHGSQQKQSTPIKIQSKCLSGVFRASEETDTGNESSEDNCNDWFSDDSFSGCISPIQNMGFNAAINLDSIFKQKTIPSLRSILNAVDSDSTSETSISSPCVRNGNHLTASLSEDDVFKDSIESSPPYFSPCKDIAAFGFSTGLCIDNLFNKKLCSENQTPAKVNGFVDDVRELESSNPTYKVPKLTASECPDMYEINAKWDKNYPSAGFRSCHSLTSDEVSDPSIKVHFATQPHLCTVYEVGTEDRGGTWHLCAVDRERFGKLIEEVESIVAPVLEKDHRAKILKRNHLWANSIEQEKQIF